MNSEYISLYKIHSELPSRLGLKKAEEIFQDGFYGAGIKVSAVTDTSKCRSTAVIPRPDAQSLLDLVTKRTGLKIPLQDSDVFVLPRSCKITSGPWLLQKHSQLEKIFKSMQNLDKAAKQQAQVLREHSDALQKFSSNNHVFISIDIEAFEKNQNCVTEIGIAVLDTTFPAAEITTRHIRIREYLHLRNGRFVPDNADNFKFGKTEIISQKMAIDAVQHCFRKFTNLGKKVVFVGHAPQGDLLYLVKMKCKLPEMPVIDTRLLFAAHCKEYDKVRNLGHCLDHLGIKNWFLHNAGTILINCTHLKGTMHVIP
ncbi:putative nucleolar protein [Neolecta irregularis DAH-3]|uniref:Putative nucleolar protein n=1 Tax=Neolecta irregularis (strain DAH-3) TaxID=1198029 RepID=A0A1U7LMI4_NEOID|nr:putative nucleolar protein [Neolecta irregularis DAH-3]|eukprot:OLL23752.1 putative nucleolar protein [Neolecta irregularis DAH-3]